MATHQHLCSITTPLSNADTYIIRLHRILDFRIFKCSNEGFLTCETRSHSRRFLFLRHLISVCTCLHSSQVTDAIGSFHIAIKLPLRSRTAVRVGRTESVQALVYFGLKQEEFIMMGEVSRCEALVQNKRVQFSQDALWVLFSC